ncbi:unnamed protein product [Heterosigma akashiwo]
MAAITWEAYFVIFVLITVFACLIKGFRTPEIIFFGGLIACWNATIISTDEAVSGFSNTGLLTVGVLNVVIKGVERSGAAARVCRRAFGSKTSFRMGMLRMQSLCYLISGFFNNTPIVALLIPITRDWARQRGFAPSHFLIPLSFAAIFGGTLTIIGTSTNLLVNGLLADAGFAHLNTIDAPDDASVPPPPSCQPAYVGAPLGLFGIAYCVLLADRLLPVRGGLFRAARDRAQEMLTQVEVLEDFAYADQTLEAVCGKLNLPFSAVVKLRRPKVSSPELNPVSSSLLDPVSSTGFRQSTMASRSRGAARNRRGDRDADTPEQLGDDAENTMGALRTSEDQDGLRTSEDQDGLVDTLEGDFHDASGIIIDEENEDGKNGEEGATNPLNVGQIQRDANTFGQQGSLGEGQDALQQGNVFVPQSLTPGYDRRRLQRAYSNVNLPGLCPPMRNGMVTLLLLVRTFGSPCFVYQPVQLRPGKLSPKGLKHKFLSYGSSTGVYRLLSPNNNVIMSKHVVFNEKELVSNSSTSSSPLEVESPSDVAPARSSSSSSDSGPSAPAVRRDTAAAPSLSSSSGRRSSSRGRRSSPAIVKTVTFADPLETVIPSSSSPAPTSAPASSPPSTRHLPTSSSARTVPAGSKSRRNRARSGGMNSRQRKRLRRRRFGRQPNTPITSLWTPHPGDTLLLLAKESFYDTYFQASDFYLISRIGLYEKPVTWWDYVPSGLFLVMLGLVAAEVVDILRAAMTAALVFTVAGWVDSKKAASYVDWRLLLLIGSALGVSQAITNSGLSNAVADAIASSNLPPSGAIFVLFAFTVLCTELVTNNAAAALGVPIATATAEALGVSHKPFAMAVMIAASMSFITPIGYQTNTMVWGPGGYNFGDYAKIGAPLSLCNMIFACFYIPLVFPFSSTSS